ncbi:MAG: divalent-cation tolerance protein CutA [Chloroflexi bacterium]|nr:MAG: divalent-cation tolerance protein CutA [Chloroflexota bacterium]
MSARPVLLLVTAATRDEAENLGEALVETGLAKRGSVVPVIHSFWMEDGKLERGHEALLLVTTSSEQAPKVEAYVREHSSFEAPHIVTLQLANETSG